MYPTERRNTGSVQGVGSRYDGGRTTDGDAVWTVCWVTDCLGQCLGLGSQFCPRYVWYSIKKVHMLVRLIKTHAYS